MLTISGQQENKTPDNGIDMADSGYIGVAVRLTEKEWNNYTGGKFFSRYNPNEEGLHYFSYGYQGYWVSGPGQDAPWQDDPPSKYKEPDARDEWMEALPVYAGFMIATTWNGIIEFNDRLINAIKTQSEKLQLIFPTKKVMTVMVGKQD